MFEELGVNALFVDEGHLFKNMEIFTKMTNVAGISSGGSQRAMDMRLKMQYINEINRGTGVVLATGTTMIEFDCRNVRHAGIPSGSASEAERYL